MLWLASPSFAQGSDDVLMERAGFMDWLLGRRGDQHPPGAGKPTDGARDPNLCLIAPAPGSRQNLSWQTQPTFVLSGPVGGMTVTASDQQTLWYAAASNGLATLQYDGVPLTPGETYYLQVYDAFDPTAQILNIDFYVLDSADQTAINADLGSLEETADPSDVDLIAQRIDYFWELGLEMDAWGETARLAMLSPEIDAALATAAERVCAPGEAQEEM